MSKISFVSFCIENYAEHIGKPSAEVYKMFKNNGLLNMLRDDYNDLHGMSMEYMISFCDSFMRGEMRN